MKKANAPLIVLALFLTACGWTMNDANTVDATLPNSATPIEMVGNWADASAGKLEVLNTGSGANVDTARRVGKTFRITANGQNCETCLILKSEDSVCITKIAGTIRFEGESTNSRGAFRFLALKGNGNSQGCTNIDRVLSPQELKEFSNRKYYYRMDGEWLRVETDKEPDDNSIGLRKTNAADAN